MIWPDFLSHGSFHCLQPRRFRSMETGVNGMHSWHYWSIHRLLSCSDGPLFPPEVCSRAEAASLICVAMAFIIAFDS